VRRALFACFALLVSCGGAAAEPPWSCQLTRVVDGDTIHARCHGEKVKVRLLRIDTPERDEPGYQAAGAALRRLLGDGAIELDFEKPGLPVADDYGRLLAYVRVRGEIANVEMVRQGWSPFWTRYGEGRMAPAFRRAEREAREARRGIWADGAPAPR
jgi:micrococcal nuclease